MLNSVGEKTPPCGSLVLNYPVYLCITVQYKPFKEVEEAIVETLGILTVYYTINSLRANAHTIQALHAISGTK